MNYNKLTKCTIFILLAISLVTFFWKGALFLSILLIGLAFIKHKILPIKKEFLWFIISGIIGTIGESLIMTSGPWIYTSTQIINFPLWLPFLWGLAGVIGISFYEAITDK